MRFVYAVFRNLPIYLIVFVLALATIPKEMYSSREVQKQLAIEGPQAPAVDKKIEDNKALEGGVVTKLLLI